MLNKIVKLMNEYVEKNVKLRDKANNFDSYCDSKAYLLKEIKKNEEFIIELAYLIEK